MVIVLIIVLLIVVLIFGVSSGADSYATAQMAQAQIETAKVAQVSAWGNLVTILVMALIIITVLALIVGVVAWILWRRSTAAQAPARVSAATLPGPAEIRPLPMNELIQLEMLRTLQGMRGNNAPALPVPHEEEPVDDPLSWLR